MLVGEQPGDKEDTAGHPFVGPAGRILDDALARAGLERAELYVTNAVKHFKWKPRGKRRIHQRPNGEEIMACSSWLDREVDDVEPAAIVAMGVTAVTALIGGRPTIASLRGTPQDSRFHIPTVVTVHPASIVRLRGREEREVELHALAADLRFAADIAAKGPTAKTLRSAG
jgi:DNA polymerase